MHQSFRLHIICWDYGLSFLSAIGVNAPAELLSHFYLSVLSAACFFKCSFLAQNTLASRLMLTALCSWAGSSGLEHISTLLMNPCWPKVKPRLLTVTCKASELLMVFSFIVSLTWQLHVGCRATHTHFSHSRILRSFHCTSFVYAWNAFFAFSAWVIPNPLFLPNWNHKLLPFQGLVTWHFLKVIFALFAPYFLILYILNILSHLTFITFHYNCLYIFLSLSPAHVFLQIYVLS